MNQQSRLLGQLATGAAILTLAASAFSLQAEVRSYTLGIGVNCPAGLGE